MPRRVTPAPAVPSRPRRAIPPAAVDPHGVVEPLEPRRLLAADLVAEVFVAPTLVGSVGTVRPAVLVRNVGDTLVTSVTTTRFALSADDEAGNEDDVTIGSTTRLGPGAGDEALFSLPVTVSQLTPGTYHVVAAVDDGGAVPEDDEGNNLAISAHPSVTVYTDSGDLAITGTDAADDIRLTVNGAVISLASKTLLPDGNVVTGEGSVVSTRLTALEVNAAAGDDTVVLSGTADATIIGGAGDDRIASGSGDDELAGSAGRDRIFGGAGNDHLVGGDGNDRLYGDAGADTVSGAAGNDNVFGGNGPDHLLGGAGNDSLFAVDLTIDTLSGGRGTDAAQHDEDDLLAGIETIL